MSISKRPSLRPRVLSRLRLGTTLILALGPAAETLARQEYFDAMSHVCQGASLSQLTSQSCQTCHVSPANGERSGNATTAAALAFRKSGYAAACSALAPARGTNPAAPTLTLVPAGSKRSARVGDTVTITAKGRDPDGSPVVLSATNLPADARFDPARGLFQWSPATPATALVVFTVTDRPGNGGAPKTRSQQVTIAVEQNRPPVLGAVRSPVTLKAGKNFKLALAATDPDAADKVKFSFGVSEAGTSTQPAGSTLRARPKSPGSRKFNAQFQWKPQLAQVGTYTVRFLASDNGKNPLQDDMVVEFRVVP